MKRNTVKTLIISLSALFVVFFLLVNLVQIVPETPRQAAKREISIDLVIEKPKPKKTEPKVKTGKAPSSSTITEEKILNGALPPISANYREHLGFKKYSGAMYARGARFYILGSSRKQIYEINFSAKSLSPVSAANIIKQNFSPRTRVIEDEPALQFFYDKAKKDLAINAPRIILLVPQQMEQKIASSLVKNDINLNKFRGFRGIYLISSGNFILKIHEGVSNSGRQKMNIAIPL